MFTSKFLITFSVLGLCTLLSCAPVSATPVPGDLHLTSQLTSEPQKLQLAPEDWAWLREKRRLVLGVAGTSALPMDIIYSNGDYEGISADVVALLKQQLNIDIQVLGFNDAQDAQRALQAGQIDLISRTSDYQQRDPATVLSLPYAENAPSLYRRQGDERTWPEDLRGMTIAVVQDYLPAALFRARYPEARILSYSNAAQAMAAVAFQGADGYMGDSLSAHYLINHSFFNYLKFAGFIDLQSAGYGFLLRRDDPQLLHILNRTLESFGRLRMSFIVKRWTGGGIVMPEDRVSLSSEEQRWLHKHPVARLMINDDMAPSAFFDADGRFNGVISDLFEIITQRTGLRFEVQRTSSFQGIQQALRDGETDLAVLTPSAERQETFRFTHPFATSSFVLVTAEGRPELSSLSALAGKRLAIARGHVLSASIARDYPAIHLLRPDNNLQAMSMVVEGQADAAVMALSMARYYTARLYEKKLRIATILDGEAATASFAMRRGDTELQSLLDKAILSIAPDELNAITLRWRANAAMSGQSWRDYGRVILEIVGCALVMMLVCMIRIFQLRRQIHRRLAAEKALNDQLQFQLALDDSMPIPIYVRDRKGRLLSCSRRYEQVMNLRQADVLGKTALEMPIEHFEVALALHNSYLQAMESGVTIERQYQIFVAGTRLCIEHWIQPFRDSSGNIKGVICGWQDISEHQRLVQDLQEAKDLAEEANQAKTQFLATISHEIRTPMSAVIGTLELALKRADQGVLDRYHIDIAYSSAKNLLELLGNTLDIVRIESGHLSFFPRRSRLKELVEPVVRVFEGLARQKNLNLLLEMDAGATCDVLIDPMRFKQVLSNLVSNAIKFTDQGQVSIRIASRIDAEQTLNLQLQVQDSGRGISEEDRQSLFRPFAQVAQPAFGGQNGSGLGLVVSRSLCEMMGGALDMHSTPGRGTTITVTLRLKVLEPLPPTQAAPLPPSQRPAQRCARVLVADDNTLNRQMLRAQLEFLGCQAVEAENGLQALQLWRQSTFDLLLTDYHMPLMNGVELTLAIRQEEHQQQRERTLIVGLTADAQQEEIERCINAGMRDCLIKPVSLDTLEERLCTLVAMGVSASPVPVEESPRERTGGIDSLSKLSMGNPKLQEQLRVELLKSNRRDLEELRRLREELNIEELVHLSHRMRGGAAILRNAHLTQLCKALEQACAEHNLKALAASAAEVEEELLRIKKTFAQTG
ncbi:transporter substrate-binding domain-containing protein [Pseudomonas sp. Au-Pse12]|uniref:transporter substrate-binding domain-containing protein n=1 Tax=Pseudomonas sp. Au-Pse12 TaxID=2906459 RepID=UPI001E3EB2CC|nr:transporter substrate-binding domain-containing protein [Pseudomonas sp. Au-Pse12]MCE4052251.1 transporter substrate-binding domain-containing protein [Pseudomonas sp. Au-Pse12]